MVKVRLRKDAASAWVGVLKIIYVIQGATA